MILHLPYPPSVNRYWRMARGRMYIDEAGTAYREAMYLACRLQGVKPMKGRLDIQIALYPPDKRKRDVDNTLKAMLDALQAGGAYADDAQIDHLELTRCEVDPPDGSVIVQIEPWKGTAT